MLGSTFFPVGFSFKQETLLVVDLFLQLIIPLKQETIFYGSGPVPKEVYMNQGGSCVQQAWGEEAP